MPAINLPAPYVPLSNYLKGNFASEVAMTFAEVEALLGFELPVAARLHTEWWTHGDSEGNAPQLRAWRDAGRKAWPNLFARSVAFQRR
jgi:hypothetical protein